MLDWRREFRNTFPNDCLESGFKIQLVVKTELDIGSVIIYARNDGLKPEKNKKTNFRKKERKINDGRSCELYRKQKFG